MTILSKTDMRDAFFGTLYGIARDDRDVVVLSNDFGAPSLDRFRADLPGQFINAAISEQNMMSTAAGMAMRGKKVVVYSIATFATLRALEQTKVDICSMKQPVTILAVGAGYAYSTDGPTHHATEDIAVMRSLAHMEVLSPSESALAAALATQVPHASGPRYIRLDRGKWPLLDQGGQDDYAAGLRVVRDGSDLVLVSTGIMVHRSIAVAERLAALGISARVVDLYRLKPLNLDLLGRALAGAGAVATIEEHTSHGGVGSIVAEAMADLEILKPLKRFAIPDELLYAYGDRDALHAGRGLDVDGVVGTVTQWLGRQGTDDRR